MSKIKEWARYRFKTKSVDDCRPLKFNPHYPWWCSGADGDMSYAVIIAFLPVGVDLFEFWDDAFDVEKELCPKIEFTDRFSKPDWYEVS